MIGILDAAADHIHNEQDVWVLRFRSRNERHLFEPGNRIENVHAGDGLVNAADTVKAARTNLRRTDDDVIVHDALFYFTT